VASRLTRHGAAVVASAISPYAAKRRRARELVERYGAFVEVYVRASVDGCARRDVEGLYGKAFAGEILSFTGVDDPYEAPAAADVGSIRSCWGRGAAALILARREELRLIPARVAA
jgi:adenylylsulfate kinase-like enzyme